VTDGSEGGYTTDTGVHGKCKAQMMGDTLVLRYLVASPSKPNAPSVRFDTVEKWHLSADYKNGNSPDIPADVMAAAFPSNPHTEKLQRLDVQ
jgi:hypothetical protein